MAVFPLGRRGSLEVGIAPFYDASFFWEMGHVPRSVNATGTRPLLYFLCYSIRPVRCDAVWNSTVGGKAPCAFIVVTVLVGRPGGRRHTEHLYWAMWTPQACTLPRWTCGHGSLTGGEDSSSRTGLTDRWFSEGLSLCVSYHKARIRSTPCAA